MGILTQLLEPRAATFGPLDDFWYEQVGIASASGVRVTPQTALTISTVFACVRIISSTLAMLPLITFQRLPDGGKERAPNHPLYDLLRLRPNVRQSSFQFREMMMGHALLRGNAYAQIVQGPRGFADQLVPLHPDRVDCKVRSDGQIVYEYRQPTGPTLILLQDEVFHISTLSDDSIKGLSIVAMARDSFGLTKSAENYGNRFFAGNQTPAGYLKLPGKALSDNAHQRVKADWKEQHGGTNNSQNIAILEEGLEWQTLGLTNEDAQHLETRSHQVEEVASWFGVPLSLLQHTEKSTSWGTGIAQLTHGFVTFTMQPWFTRWEQEISQDLILNEDQFFAEFVLEGLLRGDPETRSKFYAIMIRLGVMTRNEVRKLENLNNLDGLDEPLAPPPLPRPGGGGMPNGPGRAMALELAADAAGRMARREAGEVRKAAVKLAGKPSWSAWVAAFYDGFRADLEGNCKLPPDIALSYTNAQRDRLLELGVGAVDGWADNQAVVILGMMEGVGGD